MNNTLYISDLDGTLLNQDAELSEYTTAVLNGLIDQGINFSVATARTAATCKRILKNLHLNVPIILMNGVLVYDLKKERYEKKELLTSEQVTLIQAAMKKVGQGGLMYSIGGNKLSTYYEFIPNKAIEQFIEERVNKYGKKFTKVGSFTEVQDEIIYFTFIDSYENIHRLYDEIRLIDGLGTEKYQDIYSEEKLWYMEVFSSSASKYNAVNFLRNEYEFKKIISFGDNLNDLPMFAASDECYAVSNAKPEVKSRADRIIEANTCDGVAHMIKELEKNISE